MVLAFISRSIMSPLTATPGLTLSTRYGIYPHDNIIGQKYGQQIPSANGQGFIHVLHPTPELWTLLLPHRTQIVYTADYSYITLRLGVAPDLVVIEAGTGSASFSHAFLRTIGTGGHLYTYEFHEPRYLEAKKELELHSLVNTTITHRDVCQNGFDISGTSIAADAIFLDLPAPWLAIPHLSLVVARDRQVSICCFSPCIEQVDMTIRALEKHNWTSIEMVEVAGRKWEARHEMRREVLDVIKRLKDIQSRKNQGIEKLRAGSPGADENPQRVGKNYNPFGKGTRIKLGDRQYRWVNVTKVESEIKTHTSYLTFAHLRPDMSKGNGA